MRVVLFLIFALPGLCYSQTNDNASQPVLNHAALCARNLKTTARFYSNVMQLQKIKDPFNDTVHVWFKIGEGLALHVIQGNCAVTYPIGTHLCFSVASLEAFIKHLDILHIPYTNFSKQPKVIQLRPDGVRQIYIQDPDGYWIEINDAKQ